ncbi:MAG: UDP-N-acetylmuramoyl-L-alanine--D-glutamate ligase [Limnochordales bacterium]|nr:UDP-N-acetylmuramoyl-L-alanine--D-glutamate ligase [Limnochordales bacterium]
MESIRGELSHTNEVNEWRGRRVAVVGLGKSNLAVIRYLLRRGAEVSGRDQKPLDQLGEIGEELRSYPIELRLGPGYLEGLEEYDCVFLTPGISRHKPELVHLREAGVPVHSEIEIVLRECRAPILGITGTSGKTTTTTLVGKIMEASGRRTFVGGNIGQPLIEIAAEIPPDAVVVLELSSFQLEMLNQSPRGALVTNVSPNHLDMHADMAEYVAAKERIFLFQHPEDVAVFNLDNEYTRAMAQRARSRTFWFSLEREPVRGAWLEGENLLLRRGQGNQQGRAGRGEGEVEIVARREELLLPGLHNVANVLAACALTGAFGVPKEAMYRVITTFRGVPHRLELVGEGEVGGKPNVMFINDSIATTPARAVAGIRAMTRPTVLLAGGYDKHIPFDELAAELLRPGCPVQAVVLLGATAEKIEQAIDEARQQAIALGEQPRSLAVHRAGTFAEAVRLAAELVPAGGVVLLSPACASYDMFRNFEERAAEFARLAGQLLGQSGSRAEAVKR